MNGLNYLLQTNLYLLLFMGFYVLVLRNETFFRQNRLYLNTSIFLSFAVPFINSDWFRDLFITQQVREVAIMPSQVIYETIIVSANEEASALTVADGMFWMYVSGAAFLLTRFIVRLLLIRSNLKPGKGSAFSFFHTMVVDTELPEAATIIDHEKVHMRQWHSADILFIELAAIINWFNPVMSLYKKEIRHIHEFIADEEAATLMQSKTDYALLLFSNTLGVHPNQLSNNFFNKSLLKRRIIMLNKTKSRRTGLWKYGFSAPLFALMLIVSAAVASSENNVLSVDSKRSIPLFDMVPFTETETPKFNNPVVSESKNLLTSKTYESNSEAVINNSIAEPVPADIVAFKKHIQRTIKYPLSAREIDITGYVVINFNVTNNKITKTEIGKSLNKDVDDEVIRVFNSYTEFLELENKTYAMSFFFQLAGISPTELLPATTNNYLGQIVVTGYPVKKPENAVTYKLSEVVVDGKPMDNTIREFASIERLPEFEGGMVGWQNYISKTLKYPEEAKKNNISGRVILRFVVQKDGSLTDIKVLRGIGAGADEEAVRVLQESPKWKPGIDDGKPVSVAYTMPIFFQPAKPAEQKPEEKKNN